MSPLLAPQLATDDLSVASISVRPAGSGESVAKPLAAGGQVAIFSQTLVGTTFGGTSPAPGRSPTQTDSHQGLFRPARQPSTGTKMALPEAARERASHEATACIGWLEDVGNDALQIVDHFRREGGPERVQHG